MSKTKSMVKNVPEKGAKKDFNTSLCRVFNPGVLLLRS
jgi:hypothetical protein|tara:strand:+ start:640 stop:753 length:114 start_codon:yes stop_codon:yes gene_type:complete